MFLRLKCFVGEGENFVLDALINDDHRPTAHRTQDSGHDSVRYLL